MHSNMVRFSNPSSPPRILRDRSRVVCHRCHSRKVKCDLLSRLSIRGTCTNCEKRNELCQRRYGPRKQASGHATVPVLPPSEPAPDQAMVSPLPKASVLIDPVATSSDADRSEQQQQQQQQHVQHSSSRVSTSDVGYLGEHSIMSNHGPLTMKAGDSLGTVSKQLEEQCFLATGADQVPRQSAIDASAALYFQYLYHRCPIMDQRDIKYEGPSTLLKQSLCFVGSFLRHPNSSRSFQQTELLYTKAKILFFLNHEHDPITMLKALCCFTFWNVKAPSIVTLDCSWNWLGLASRLAMQMGLHRESTHLQGSMPNCARRIAWYIYCMDKMLSSCFGRPQMLRNDEFDVRPLTLTDFDASMHDQARCFIMYTGLTKISGRILDLQRRQLTSASEEVLSVLADLSAWALDMTTKFPVSDAEGQLVYHLACYEYLASYLTQILTYFHTFEKLFKPSVAARISLVASSCMIAIYQEIDYRDHMNYLCKYREILISLLCSIYELAPSPCLSKDEKRLLTASCSGHQ